MFNRNIQPRLRDALTDTPVVMLVGARQTGKSTLVKNLSDERYKPTYLSFDDPTNLAAAKGDPIAFLEGASGPSILDEIQRVPELFLPIKTLVDRDRRPGRFLLTGSANVLLMPTVADSLAGRMEILSLNPLSQGEIDGQMEDFIDWVSAEKFEPDVLIEGEERSKLFQRMLTGGYPEAVSRRSESRRDAWFASYITTLLQRDVRDLANIEGLTDLPRLLSLMAARAGGLLNYSEISRSGGLPQTTLKRYITLLEQLFLVEHLPAYSGSLGKRLSKSPKLFFGDTGLLAHLQGLTWEKIKFETSLAGLLTENFVYSEIRKQLGWSVARVHMMHFRTSSDLEVDIVLELPSGEVVGIEVKSGTNVDRGSFKGLKALQSSLGRKFRRGIVLYAGDRSVAFEKYMFAVPLQTLWRKNLR